MEEMERIERERAAEEALLPKSPAVLRRKLSGMFRASVVANGLRGTFVTRFGGSNKKLQSPPAVSPASAPKSMWASIPGDRCEPVAKGEGEAPVGEPAEAPVGEPAAVSGTSFGTAAVGEHFAGPGWEHDESSEAASKEGGGSDGEWWGEDEGYAEPLEDLEQWLVGALGVDSAAQGPVWVSGVDFGDGAERAGAADAAEGPEPSPARPSLRAWPTTSARPPLGAVGSLVWPTHRNSSKILPRLAVLNYLTFDAPQIAQNVAAGVSNNTNRGILALRNSLTPIGAMNLLAKESLSRSPLGSQHSTTPSHGDKKLHRCVVDEGSAIEQHSRTLSSFKATTCRL